MTSLAIAALCVVGTLVIVLLGVACFVDADEQKREGAAEVARELGR